MALVSALVALALALPRGAAAHGRDISATRIERSAAGVALFTTRGPVLEGGDGAYEWVCSRPYGDSGQAFVPPLTRTDSGTLLASSLSGVFRRAPGTCAFVPSAAPLGAIVVTDVIATPGTPATMFAVTAEPSDSNVIARSLDEGASFTTFAVGADRLASVRADAGAVRVAAAGAVLAGGVPESGVLWWSEDGGVSFERLLVPLEGDEHTMHVEAIGAGPVGAPIVWLRTLGPRFAGVGVERALRVDLAGGASALVERVLDATIVHDIAPDHADPNSAWIATSVGLRHAEGTAVSTLADVEYTALLDDETGLLGAPRPSRGQPIALCRLDAAGRCAETPLAYDDVAAREPCDGGDEAAACDLDYEDLVRDAATFRDVVEPPGGGGGCNAARRSGSPAALIAGVILALGCRRRPVRVVEK